MFGLFNNKAKKAEDKEKPDEDWLPFEGNWLPWTKGTVAEPWPTAEELLNDPKVQNEIEKVREAFSEVEEQKDN